MRLDELDFDLPEALIAQRPLEDRAASRLLHVDRDTAEIRHRMFRDVPKILRPGDLLVLNDTRVNALRLRGRRATGGEVEALLVEELGSGVYEALVRPAKRLRNGERLQLGDLTAEVTGRRNELVLLRFEAAPQTGEPPLPPYIHTALTDAERYQTVYADEPGSAAAPTAGLHFTPEILGALEARGVSIARVTLHVGIDTFRPLTTENLDEHRMHGERASIPEGTARAIADAPGRIVAVGTTSVRTLEGLATGRRRVEATDRRISPFIRPGWTFQVVDGMFTNFHLPRTTMLAMLSALMGRDPLMGAYREAIREKYRWASFGDSMLIL